MIIGLTGLNAAGKGAVAEYLVERGFVFHSLSDSIRDVLTQRGEEHSRENMIRVGRELRERGGAGALAHGILRKLDDGINHVVDSFRNPAEVEVFREHGDFAMLHVTATEAVRFDRIKGRGRVGDPTDIETFRRLEEAELTGGPAGQQLLATAAKADHDVPNDSSIEALKEVLDPLVLRILQSQSRPGWDEYFMNIAHEVALRSNCGGGHHAGPPRDLHRLQRHPTGRPELQRGWLSALQLPGSQRHGAQRVSVLTRRRERHHSGRVPRHARRGRHDLRDAVAMSDVHENDY